MDTPRFAIFDRLPNNPANRAAGLAAMGFDTVVIPFDRDLARVSKSVGLHVWVCTATFPVAPGAGDVLARDVYGVPRMWFQSGSPSLRSLRDAHLDTVRTALSWPEVDGFYLDGIRFAAPSSGIETFLTCFREETALEVERLGFEFSRMRTDVRRFGHQILGTLTGWERLAGESSRVAVWDEYPGAANWLEFRSRFISEFVAENAVVASESGKLLGAYLYSPAFSQLVGQDYSVLRDHLAIISPMIYRLEGWESTLATEVCALVGRVATGNDAEEARLVRAVLQFCGLEAESSVTNREILARGFPPGAVASETARASAALRGAAELVPIVRIEDDELAETVAGVKAAGADGISFFTAGGSGRDWAPIAARASLDAFG